MVWLLIAVIFYVYFKLQTHILDLEHEISCLRFKVLFTGKQVEKLMKDKLEEK